jgi:hypothetical protein
MGNSSSVLALVDTRRFCATGKPPPPITGLTGHSGPGESASTSGLPPNLCPESARERYVVARTDPLGNRCDRVLRLHCRQVNHTPDDIYLQIDRAQRIFGKYGIFLQVASIAALRMSNTDLTRLTSIVTECFADQSTAAQDDLYRRFGVQDLASVNAFFVQRLPVPAHPPLQQEDPLDGCAGHVPHRPMVLVAAFADTITLAHELGHVLLAHAPDHLREHSTGPVDVMREGRDDATTFKSARFSIKQLEWIRRSPLLLPC